MEKQLRHGDVQFMKSTTENAASDIATSVVSSCVDDAPRELQTARSC
jgi:hypothetical protein